MPPGAPAVGADAARCAPLAVMLGSLTDAPAPAAAPAVAPAAAGPPLAERLAEPFTVPCDAPRPDAFSDCDGSARAPRDGDAPPGDLLTLVPLRPFPLGLFPLPILPLLPNGDLGPLPDALMACAAATAAAASSAVTCMAAGGSSWCSWM